MTVQQLALFVPVAFLVGVSPGANNLLAFASAARAGWRRAAQAVAGRIAGYGLKVGEAAQAYVAAHLADPAFRQSVRDGMLESRWDILCPRCRGAQLPAMTADIPRNKPLILKRQPTRKPSRMVASDKIRRITNPEFSEFSLPA